MKNSTAAIVWSLLLPGLILLSIACVKPGTNDKLTTVNFTKGADVSWLPQMEAS